ncbi:LTA synthase family protein [Acidaminobacter sp. JC074]|uniref:LTA synthase family protein n=1 Tax=Acidaminobacter sp. JC074 TaxID=2530199 RepID=UPI001F0EA696|nr:LTA synthase family protein [Acidaminobacter sp. JC074]MCH4890880.1 LTA synthase family protein [Acidaminobacter sp. JC074]
MVLINMYIIFIIFYSESLVRESSIEWILKYPINVGINFIIYISTVCLLGLFIPLQFSLASVTSLVLLLGFINRYKISLRGDHFYPWDVALGRESSNMMSYVKFYEVLISIFHSMLLVGIVFFLETQSLYTYKLLYVVFGVMILILSYQNHKVNLGINQHKLHFKKGIILAFILNLKEWKNCSYLQLANEEDLQTTKSIDNERPNIIVIMNESFWNPENLPNVKFSKPLTSSLDSLKIESMFGNMVSPEFGGGTSNIEYEILSGQSMYYLPTGMMAFNTCINKDVAALPRLLANNGYETIGVHSYKKWFWDREKAYKHLGFQSFITEEDFAGEVKGDYISDIAFSRKIIDIYRQTRKPLFLYGVTMQNHGPYYYERYNTYDVDVKAPLNRKELGELRCYAQGVYDADRALGVLIDFFRKEKKETYVVFFGDHLPMLGRQFSVYKKCGYIKSKYMVDWNREEQYRMHSTPFVIWSNKTCNSADVGYLSPAKIGDYILDLTSTKKTDYYRMIHNRYSKNPVISKRIG